MERPSEHWRIFGFDAIYMRDELTPSIPGEHISISHGEVRDFRASYRILSYYLHSQGYDIDPNLAGEDRADLVEALNRELSNWLEMR